MPMTIRSATPADLPHVRRLLAANALPVQDVDTTPIEFLVAERDGHLLGAVGLELFGDAALLRSLVVDTSGRGTGVGGALVEAIEAHAAAAGVADLALLTTTAAPFFARRGWQTVPRDALPAGVQRSGEFRSLCPASATA
ncbi:MAG TPA: arsenic resistance N-acetyltransferase ArsN2, partial [Gemmatimonadales bacterium]|nr:arsenic resistance N-acetyltransferase ArsN2 [Gemmatimonadales bacterium]